MAKYVMSDIHGCYDKFIEMLDKIKFCREDKLYILGDIFDRGENPLMILDYIVDNKNVYLLKGNHEYMYEEAYEYNDFSMWYANGGEKTYCEIVMRDELEEETIYQYIKKLPFIMVVDKFILVHGGVYFPANYDKIEIEELIKIQEEDTCLWDRLNLNGERVFKDYKVIRGHTPTQTITGAYKNASILYRGSDIFIDCGCVFTNSGGRLACLRLDDMKEFYV